MAGKKYYLIQVRNVGIHSPKYPVDTSYYIQVHPGATNQSGEPRTEGWLGTTNDIAEYACGEFGTLDAARAAIPTEFVPVAPDAVKYIAKREYARLRELEARRWKE